jgi:hypothetical protein
LPDFQTPAVGPFSLEQFFQDGAEGIRADDADDKRGLGPVKGAVRPLHEVGQIVEKRGLDLIFLEFRFSRLRCSGQAQQKADQGQQPRPASGAIATRQKRHVTFPKTLRST